MTKKPTPKEPDNVACEVCLAEIPESVATNSEADEYAHHFCGTECYKKWRGTQQSKEQKTGTGS
jgi:hypothetical protein